VEIDFGRTVPMPLARPNPSGGQLVTVIDRFTLPRRQGSASI
jgi:hypothetical protein